MENYVVGFMFTEDKQHVVLIRKNRPSWQRGKLNGVGGRIECNESPFKAMAREFFEEAGVATLHSDWTNFAVISSGGSKIYVFRCFNDGALSTKTMEDEVIFVYKVNELPENIIGNIKWLLHMALDDKLNFPVSCEEKNRGYG